MNYKEALKQLKTNKIPSTYLLYGEEIYLRDNFLEELINAIVDEEFMDLNYHTIKGKDFNMGKLIDACETLPFMAERKLILVKDFDGFQRGAKNISETEEKELTNYLEKVPQTTCLVFVSYTTIDARKRLVKQAKKHGQVINFQKISGGELRKWIVDKFRGHGKDIASRELEYFLKNINYIGRNSRQNLFDIDNEIQKIISFMGEKNKVKLEDLQKIFTTSFQNDIFKLLDAMGQKHQREALKRLGHMVGQGEPIIKIGATLGNHIRNLLKVKLLLEEGYTSKIIASKLGIHPFVVRNCVNQGRVFTLGELEDLLKAFVEMDLSIKTGAMNEHIAMELFVHQCSSK